MGQYYLAVNLSKKEYLEPHDYDNGAKLMEHSYLGNDFVGAVLKLMKKEWKEDRVVWMGDYFEKDEIPEIPVDWGIIIEKYKKISPKKADVKTGFLNNHDQKLSIDLSKVKAYEDKEDIGWELNPLPLLTALGNGRGGGDFNNEEHYLFELIGTWAGDKLSYSSKAEFKTTRFFNNDPNSVDFITED